MKKILIFSILSFLLVSCSGELSISDLEEKKANLEKEITEIDKTIKENQTGGIVKQDFLIQTKKLSEFGGEYRIKKNGKINSSQDIDISSNSAGRINQLLVREGENVVVGQILLTLEDNIGSYGINLSRAQNALDRANINYNSSELSLDNNIFNAKINLDKLNDNLIALKNDKTEALRNVAIALENTDTTSGSSKSSLELEKIDSSIEKIELDYEIKVIADKETIEGFSTNLKKDYNSLLLVIDDIIEFSDKLLGITEENKNENDKFDDFLGAKDKIQKSISENNLRELINYRNKDFLSIDFNNLTEEEFLENIVLMESGYDITRLLLNNLEKTLNNSVESVGTLGKVEITSFVGTINIYQSTLQGNYTGFVAFKNSSKSFLRTYVSLLESLNKQIELLKKDREILKKSLSTGKVGAEVNYQKTLISYNDRIISLESQILIATKALENSKDIKSITLRSLYNFIKEAKIGLTQAKKEYSKLTIHSPISGVIGDVFVDLGQEISNGRKTFNIINDNIPEIKVGFDKKELISLEVGDKSFTSIDGKVLTGTLVSLSTIADSNLKYTGIVVFNDKLDLIGNIIELSFNLDTNMVLVPLNILKIGNEEKKGILKRLNFVGGIDDFEVMIGKIHGDKIEIVDLLLDKKGEIIDDFDIILNDTTQFDEDKFEVKKK